MALNFITAEEAASYVKHNMNVAFSGFTPAGSPKEIPTAIATKATKEHEIGNPYKIGIITGASTGDSLDGELARANAIKFRTPYQSNKDLRASINSGQTEYFDIHLSQIAQEIRYNFLGEIDVAIIEAADINEKGEVILTSAVGIVPTIARLAKKVFIELNESHPKELKGMHDIYELQDPPYRRAVPIYTPRDLCGQSILKIDPDKIIGIVKTNREDQVRPFSPSDELTNRIGENVAKFLANEIKKGIIPPDFLPIQSGVGNIANSVLGALGSNSDIPPFMMYTEVIQDSVIELMKKGYITFVSCCSMTLAPEARKTVYDDLTFFKPRMILRPQELSNNPEVVRRLGLITINTALEADLFGNINSTHVLGTTMMNGIGGSGDFTRNAFLSIFTCPSTAKGGAISTIVPFVSHVDHSEHSVKVIITENGIADLRGKSPKQRAQTIIDNCVHPDYKQLLRDYVNLGGLEKHTPHTLSSAFNMHKAFMETKDMHNTSW